MNRLKTYDKNEITGCAFDGAAFHGQRGLAISCLSGKSRIIKESKIQPDCWIIPLDEVELVSQSANLGGERLWLAPAPPETFLGCLAQDYQGAWFDHDMIYVQIDNTKKTYAVKEPDSRDETLAMLVFAAGMTWKGCAEEEILKILKRFKPTTKEEIIEEMSLI